MLECGYSAIGMLIYCEHNHTMFSAVLRIYKSTLSSEGSNCIE